MTKYENRQLQLIDLLDRFERAPSWKYTRDALGLIGRLKDDGAIFWDEGSTHLAEWHKYADELWVFKNNLGQRRDSNKQDLQTAMREFFQTFEHSERRMDQMLHQFADSPEFDVDCTTIRESISLVFRLCSYALVSYWIDDKQESTIVRMRINLISGERREEWHRIEMRVPKEYRYATQKFWTKSTKRSRRRK